MSSQYFPRNHGNSPGECCKIVVLQVLTSMIDQIRKGMALKLHPDISDNYSGSDDFYLKCMNEACTELSDPVRRKRYTDWLQQ